MDNAIKGFCDYVSRQGQVDLEYCGINENNEFFYNHQVAPAPLARRRLIDGMKKHSQLIHLANRVVITRADVAAYYSSPSVPQQGGYSLQATGYGYSASIGGVAYRPLMPAASAPYAGSLGTSYSPFTPPAPSFHTGGLGGTLSSPLMPTPTTNAVIRGESPAVMFTPAPQANLYSTFASASATPLLPSSTGPVYQNAEDTSTEIRVLPGSVVRINNPLGIGQVIEHLDLGKKSYGIVNSIDKLGELQAGVAKDIKRVVGSNYERVIRDRQTGVHGNCRVNYGECFTYDCSFNSWSKPQKLNNCRLVLNVLVPFSVNPKFDLHLKNSILKVLEEAAQYGINRLYFPLWGCGRAGGNGRQLAKAIYEAKRDFESCNDQKAPKIFLVSRGSPSEQRTCVDFDDQWSTLMASSVPSSTPSSSARRSKSPAPSRASSGAAANASPSGAGLSSRPRPAASLSPVASTPSTSKPDFPVSIKRDTAQARVDADARSQRARRSKSPAPSRASSGAAANVSPSGAGLSSSPRPAASLSPVASTLRPSMPDFPVSARRDTARADADLGRVVPRAQSSFEPQSGLSYIETSLGDRVELVKSNRGIEDFVRLQYFTEPYGIVNSIDKFGHFRGGVAKAIADMAGDRYAETISEMQNSDDPSEQLSYGQCVTYELKRSGKTSDLEKLQTVHSVLIPFSEDPSFDEHLKDSILRVFEEAVQHELDLIIFPLLGCGRAGGTGGQLAQAVYAARRDFKSRSGKEAPKMVLVGSNSLADQKTVEDFKCKCSVIAPAHDLVALNTRRAGSAVPFRASSGATANTSPSEAELSSRSRPSASSVAGTLRPSRSDYPVSARRDTDRARVGVDARSRSRRLELPTPSRSRSGAAASSGTTEASRDDSAVSPKVLISDQLEVVMHPNGGMFGYAKELSSRGEAFDLVNAANGYMAHNGGIAAQFKKDLGSGFEEDTKKLAQQRPEGEVPAGQCITTGAYNYAENQSLGLMNCQHIHHVVAPIRQRFDPQQYNEAFKEAFVSLLLAANENGGNTIVSCFIGCAIFGGSGHDMACALHAAYHDSRVTSLSKVPKLILSGWEKTDSATIGDDRRVYDDFIQTFEALNAEKPVHLPSGITPVASSTDISETAFPAGAGAIQKTPSSGASAFPVASSLSASRSDSSGSVGKDIGLIRDDGVSEEPLTNGITLVRLGIGGELEDYLGLFYKNKSYGIVNSIDSLRRLEDDVAKAIRDMAGGHQKKMNGRLNPSNQPDQEEFGQCVTCEFGHSGKTAKLAHLKTIHNVLIPSPENSDFEKLLKESILGIFKEAEQHKIDILVSPFLGCRFGEFGETDARLLARAIYAARYAFELRYFKKAPEMLLVGKGSALDEGNFACFEREWAGLHQLGSTTLSSTRKEPAAGVARVSETADITSTAPRGKTIECGNCHETKAEANSKTIAGTPICSGCIDEFVAEGVDFARMDDKYNAIEYEPFQPHEVEGESVPGYPDVGLIKVCLGGTGPEYLDGRKLNVFSKSHQAYFPNNRIGRELVRIFSVLHEKKLIYVIDESKTLGCMGDSPLVRPDFHNRKVDLTERGFFFRTAVGKKIFFADLDEEGFKKYGIERSFGLTFNVHFKTSLFGPHGYERDDGTIDYDYFGRVLNEIEDIAEARGIRDELGLDNLVALLTSDAIDEGKGGS